MRWIVVSLVLAAVLIIAVCAWLFHMARTLPERMDQ